MKIKNIFKFPKINFGKSVCSKNFFLISIIILEVNVLIANIIYMKKSNFFNVVREIVNTLKGAGAASSFLSLGSMTSNSGNNVQQRVEITAEFPNVDTADDIREALLSLADNAYQYAYKNR